LNFWEIKGMWGENMPSGPSPSSESFQKSSVWLAASPLEEDCRILARRMERTFGIRGFAFLLAVPQKVALRWCAPISTSARRGRMLPRNRRLIWLLYAVLMHPELLRSPLDILTGGRFVQKSAGGPVNFRKGSESMDWECWCWEI
jgi:hypothetical protein